MNLRGQMQIESHAKECFGSVWRVPQDRATLRVMGAFGRLSPKPVPGKAWRLDAAGHQLLNELPSPKMTDLWRF